MLVSVLVVAVCIITDVVCEPSSAGMCVNYLHVRMYGIKIKICIRTGTVKIARAYCACMFDHVK